MPKLTTLWIVLLLSSIGTTQLSAHLLPKSHDNRPHAFTVNMVLTLELPLSVGQAVPFNNIPTVYGHVIKPRTSSFKIKKKGVYLITFIGKVDSETTGKIRLRVNGKLVGPSSIATPDGLLTLQETLKLSKSAKIEFVVVDNPLTFPVSNSARVTIVQLK